MPDVMGMWVAAGCSWLHTKGAGCALLHPFITADADCVTCLLSPTCTASPRVLQGPLCSSTWTGTMIW